MAEEIKEQVEDVQNSADSSTEETYTKEQVQKLIDSEISKAVNKYKETTYRKDLDMGIKRALEDMEKKTPEQIQLENLKKELEQERNIRLQKERDLLKDSNYKKATSILSEKGLPLDFADFVASEDEEVTNKNLEKVINALSGVITKTKQTVIDGNNIKVPSKTGQEPDDSELTPQERMTKKFLERQKK